MPGERPSPAWARRLAELRRARAWSPADLACELKKLRDGLPSGRSLAHMIQMDWESGKHRPGPRYRLLLAAVYDADEQDIFGGELASPAISLRSVDRRDVLAAFCLSPAADVTASHPQQVAPELIDYFRSQLAGHYRADAFLGPHFLIPTVTEQYRLINTLTGSAAGKVRTELLEVATAYAALIGWLHQDAGNTPQSAYWRSATLDMAHRRDDPDLISYALANKAMLATDMGNGQTVIDFSEAARLGGRRLMPKTRIMAAVQSAHGHSLVGQRRECDRLLDAAAHLAGQVGDDHVWGNACRRTPGYFEVHRATCYGRLGADGEAATLWSEILDVMPASARRDTAVFRARHAAALAATGHAEETKRIAEDSVKLVQETGSARLRQELLAIPAKMSAWADATTGRELDEVLASIR